MTRRRITPDGPQAIGPFVPAQCPPVSTPGSFVTLNPRRRPDKKRPLALLMMPSTDRS